MNASVNTERILLTIRGAFEGVIKEFVKILVKFSKINRKKVFCTIKMIQNNRFVIIIAEYKIQILYL